VLTGERREWTVPSLPTGIYETTVSAQGFKTARSTDIKLDPGVPATLNVTLELGAVAETVDVRGGLDMLQSSAATVSSTLIGRQLSDLPFTSRNLTELLDTQPGTSTPGIPRSSSVNALPGGEMNVTSTASTSRTIHSASATDFSRPCSRARATPTRTIFTRADSV
jgi:hypothetical protein